MEYNITLKDRKEKWKLLHTTKNGNFVVINENEAMIVVDPAGIDYDEVLANFVVEAYITIKATSPECAMDRVRDDLDKFEYVGVSLGCL